MVPGLVFFITNDIVGKDVYVGNLSNFWDVCVICSQLISLGSLAYSLFKFAFKFNKNHIEVVDKLDEKENCEDQVEKKEIVTEEKSESTFTEKEEESEIKSITESNKEITAPFMEEEN